MFRMLRLTLNTSRPWGFLHDSAGAVAGLEFRDPTAAYAASDDFRF